MAAEPFDATAVKPAPPGAKRTRKVLVKKAKQGAPIKKYAWLAGHGLTIGCGAIYLFFYTFRWFLSSWWWTPLICYRLAFIGVIVSYTVTILTTFGAVVPSYNTLLATENFQNLVLAGIWLVSRASAFKLFPYYAVALLQLANMFNVKPILKLQDQLSDAIAVSEIAVIVALLLDTLLFRGTSGFALAIYLMFYWLRINFSPYTQAYILRIIDLVDEKVMKKQKPEMQAKWKKVKDFIEFRRSQTALVYKHELEEEPAVIDTSDHSNAGNVVDKGEQREAVGQVFKKETKEVPQGTIREETPVKRQQPMPTSATPASATTTTTTSATTSASTSTPVQGTSMAQASGRISAPTSQSTPSKHTLDPRQQLINNAQQSKTAAQSELETIKQQAQSQVASTQNA